MPISSETSARARARARPTGRLLHGCSRFNAPATRRQRESSSSGDIRRTRTSIFWHPYQAALSPFWAIVEASLSALLLLLLSRHSAALSLTKRNYSRNGTMVIKIRYCAVPCAASPFCMPFTLVRLSFVLGQLSCFLSRFCGSFLSFFLAGCLVLSGSRSSSFESWLRG